jgi:LytS/YehU family sensor histidine kinase
LLENAFKHGVERAVAPVHITIGARRDGDSLVISVNNSGSLLAAGPQDGVGLRNCRGRLGIIYGGTASLVVRNEDDGVVARVSLPLTEAVP